jgi:hypothetical protein
MFRYASLLMLLFVSVSPKADPLPLPLPDAIYFSVDWCPRAEDIAELSKYLDLTMNGCCIGKATVLSETKTHPEFLAPWEYRTSINGYPRASCGGKVLSEQEEIYEKFTYYKQKNEREEKEKLEAAANLSSAPSKLREMTLEVFCSAYGRALRDGYVDELGSLPSTILVKLIKSESGRRKYQFDDELVHKGQIRLGLSECQLFASWGISEEKTPFVGRLSARVQHTYFSREAYVIMDNGVVTSWHY